MARRWFLVFTALSAWISPHAAPAPATSQSFEAYLKSLPPNIVILVADDLAPDDLGCYGATPTRTPQLDRLAAEGLRFTQAYAGGAESAPSRAALLTGRHPGHLGIRGGTDVPLTAADLTLAKLLQPAGYTSYALGAWGLGLAGSTGTPWQQGFDEWLGYLSLEQAQDHYPTQLWRNADLLIREKNFYNYRGEFAQDLITQAATNCARINKLTPFFLYLAYPTHLAGKDRPALISRLDADVGKLTEELKRLKIESRTLVLFTSDNGPAPAATGHAGAGGQPRLLAEARLRVPLLAWWPGTIAAGRTSPRLCALWDLLPTVAAAAKTNAPPHTDGISLLPTLLGQAQTNSHEYLYWESHADGSQQALRQGDWKALRRAPKQPLELYFLPGDPGETNNVAGQHPALRTRLERLMNQARTDSPRWPLQTKR